MDQPDDAIFESGDVIFATAEPLASAYFILEGRVALQLELNGRTLQLEVGPNQFLGDIGVVVDTRPGDAPAAYHARAVAIEPVRAAVIPVDDIKKELAACPPLLRAWIASFVSRVLLIVEELSAPQGVS